MKALGVSERDGLRALRQPADPLHARRRARPSTSSCPRGSTRASAILVWSPLAGGLLSGKYRRGQRAARRARATLDDWDEPPVRDQERLYDIVDVLVEVAEAHGVSAAQVALAWLLAGPA